MTAGKRIAFAVPGDLSTLTGGYIYDSRVMAELRHAGWEVTHLALPDSFPAPSAEDMTTTADLIGTLPHPMPVIIDGLAFGAFDPLITAQFSNPIVALVHHPLARESGIDRKEQWRLFESEKANLRFARHVIVPSPHTARILTQDYAVPCERISVARPGIDQPHTPRIPANPPLILSVGIQLPRKGHDILLKALARIADLDWRAVIAGKALDPSYATDLQELRRSLGLEARVDLAGQVAREALNDLYLSASLFALATRYEGYGIVFDEALVHGLPIVSCRAGAVPDTVPDAAAVLVGTDDPDAFAEALRRMLTDQAFRDGAAEAALKAGRARPGWDETASVFAAVLEREAEAAT